MFEAIKRFFRPERRAYPSNSWYSNTLPDADALAGWNHERLTAVEACVRVLGDAVASLPLKTYRAAGMGKTEARDTSLWAVLHDAPNTRQTSFDFRREAMRAVLLTGNAYAQVQRDDVGDVVALWPLATSRVQPLLAEDGTKFFRIQSAKDGQIFLSGADVLHIHGHLAADGVTGLSAIEVCKNALRLASSAESYAAEFFENSAEPGGVLERPITSPPLDNAGCEILKTYWEQSHSKGKRHKVAILQEGTIYKPVEVNHADLQFLELRNFQVSEICRIFGVPNHLVNDLSRATFSNIEQQSLEFLTHSLRPWLVNFEQEFTRVLLAGEPDLSIEFSVDGFLRGDAAARSAMYVAGIQNGWLSPNDVRKLENLNPVAGGDSFNFLGNKREA